MGKEGKGSEVRPETDPDAESQHAEQCDGAFSSPVARFVEFREAAPAENQDPALSVEQLHDVPLTVRVEIGRTDLTADALLAMEKGSVIKLNKMAGEPVDLYLRETRFARGEVTVVDGNFRLRVTDVVTNSHTTMAEGE